MFKYNWSKFYEKMIFKLCLICTSYWSRRKYHNILSDADWVGTVNLILLCENILVGDDCIVFCMLDRYIKIKKPYACKIIRKQYHPS